MNRRQLIIAVIMAAVSAGIAVHSVARNADSAAVFVHDLYTREVERHNKRLAPDNKAFNALFTNEMHELMNAPRLANPKMPLGPMRHTLFGNSVLPGTPVILSGVTTARDLHNEATLNVALTVHGEIRQLGVTVRRQGIWRIHDIEYEPGDTLSGFYRRMAGR